MLCQLWVLNLIWNKVRSIAEMDHYENIPDLLAIGRKASEQFTETNLPTSFDL